MADGPAPLLIFDGDCAFCTASADWLARAWSGEADVAAWQQLGPAGLRKWGLAPQDCREAAFWVDPSGQVFRGHQAIARALMATPGWRRTAGTVILHPVVEPIARMVYRAVARYRYRLPGGSDACRVPIDGC